MYIFAHLSGQQKLHLSLPELHLEMDLRHSEKDLGNSFQLFASNLQWENLPGIKFGEFN